LNTEGEDGKGAAVTNVDIVEKAKEAALAVFNDPGPSHVNCAQAVLHFGLRLMEQPTDMITIARYFGGGVAGMGHLCGAVTGAALALGARDMLLPGHPAEAAAASRDKLQATMRAFQSEFRDSNCRELTGFDVSTPEGFKAFKASEASKRCAVYVSWMCDQLAPLLVE
jgi:C_GCAxxG_C_C family probable redox protein